LVELFLVRSVGSFHLALQSRRARLDVDMTDTLVLDMPMEFGLKLMSPVCADFPYSERKLFDDVIDKITGVFWL